MNPPLDRAILTGVARVEGHGDDGALVTYDGGEVTVMDLIRALRKLGFLAGMG
jgi:hypothetical protein